MPDVVGALVRHEEFERGGQQFTDVVKRPWAEGAIERLQFGERLFDGIEVRTVGREKAQPRAGVFDGGAHLGLFVGREIVEDDDIARPERRHEDLLDVRAERLIVDRAIEHGGGGQRRRTEGGDDGVRLPVAAGRVIRDAGATRTPGVQPEQVGGDARLIDEDKVPRIVERDRRAPLAAIRRDIRASLFVGVYAFFLPSVPVDRSLATTYLAPHRSAGCRAAPPT